MRKVQIMRSIFVTIMSRLRNRDLSSDSPFSRSSCNLFANMSSNCAVPVWFAFIVKFCGKFSEEQMLCPSNFSLWLLLIGFALDPLFDLISHHFQSSSYLFDHFAENVRWKRVTNYWTTIGVHCLILSSHFSTAEVLLLMAWSAAAAKTTFILKIVRPLMVRLSLACGPAFQK